MNRLYQDIGARGSQTKPALGTSDGAGYFEPGFVSEPGWEL